MTGDQDMLFRGIASLASSYIMSGLSTGMGDTFGGALGYATISGIMSMGGAEEEKAGEAFLTGFGMSMAAYGLNYVVNVGGIPQASPIKDRTQETELVNPTGGEIRGTDIWGSGAFGAPRVNRKAKLSYKHKGVDYLGGVGKPVYGVIGGNLKQIGSGPNTGVEITNQIYRAKLLHMNVTVDQSKVAQGQVIGTVKNLSPWYKGMPSHIHLELYKNGQLIDPTNLVPVP